MVDRQAHSPPKPEIPAALIDRWRELGLFRERPSFASPLPALKPQFISKPRAVLKVQRAAPQTVLVHQWQAARDEDRSYAFATLAVVAEVLKGRWTSALLGSFTVGQNTGDNFMLV